MKNVNEERENIEVEELFDEEYEDNDDNGEDYEQLEILKGVGVKDTEKGFDIVLMGASNNILNVYNIEEDIKGYEYDKLFNICYNISQKVNEKYYETRGELTKEDIIEIVKGELI